MTYRFFQSENSKTGGLQLSNNRLYYYGNFLRNKEFFDFDSALLRGNVYEAFWYGTVPANSSLYFSQIVPSTRLLRSISYKQTIIGGPILFDLAMGGTPGAVAETFLGYNGDRRRYASGDLWTSTSYFERYSSYNTTETLIIDEWFGLSPTGGNRASSGTLSELGIGGLYDANSKPVFLVTNEDTRAATINLSWVWIELDETQVEFLPIE